MCRGNPDVVRVILDTTCGVSPLPHPVPHGSIRGTNPLRIPVYHRRAARRVGGSNTAHTAMEQCMQIESSTATAAGEVVSLLLSALLRPGREFHIAGEHEPELPVRLTLSANLPADVLRKLQDIPDTRIIG